MPNPTASGLPNPFLDDSVRIPGWQRRLHFYSELVAILMLPRLWNAAKDASPKHKGFLKTMFWGTAVIDSYLVYKWATDPALQSQAQRANNAMWAAGSIQSPPPAGPGAPPSVIFQAPAYQPGVIVMSTAR